MLHAQLLRVTARVAFHTVCPSVYGTFNTKLTILAESRWIFKKTDSAVFAYIFFMAFRTVITVFTLLNFRIADSARGTMIITQAIVAAVTGVTKRSFRAFLTVRAVFFLINCAINTSHAGFTVIILVIIKTMSATFTGPRPATLSTVQMS